MLDSSKIGARVNEIGAHLDGVGAQLEGVGMPDYMRGLIRAVEVLPDPETLAASKPDAQALGIVVTAIKEVANGISGVREELVKESAQRVAADKSSSRLSLVATVVASLSLLATILTLVAAVTGWTIQLPLA